MVKKLNLRYLLLGSLLAALTVVGGQLTLPIGPVPFTLQTLFVILTGLLLPRSYAMMSMFIHFLLMMIIAGANPFSPTFGFLIGFIITMVAAKSIKDPLVTTNHTKIVRTIVMTIIIYSIGLTYMYLILNNILNIPFTLWHTISTGFLIFIPSDILKYAIAIILANKIEKNY